MELLEADLHSLIYNGKKLPPETCAKLMLQLCSGLIYMHSEHSLIHRDVKPANIFVTEQRLKLGDFGLTMEEHGAGASEICGTPEYMPYEIWNVAEPDCLPYFSYLVWLLVSQSNFIIVLWPSYQGH